MTEKEIMSDFPLSPQQIKLFRFLKSFYKRKKYMPTYEEIRVGIKINSRSQIKRVLDKLDEKGFIERKVNASRQIRILKDI